MWCSLQKCIKMFIKCNLRGWAVNIKRKESTIMKKQIYRDKRKMRSIN